MFTDSVFCGDVDRLSVLLLEKECLRYDREFLLRLRYSPESQHKPVGLPQMPEIIVDMVTMLPVLIFL